MAEAVLVGDLRADISGSSDSSSEALSCSSALDTFASLEIGDGADLFFGVVLSRHGGGDYEEFEDNEGMIEGSVVGWETELQDSSLRGFFTR